MLLQKKSLQKKALQKKALDFCLENQSCDRRNIRAQIVFAHTWAQILFTTNFSKKSEL